jgi:hypothetical protein
LRELSMPHLRCSFVFQWKLVSVDFTCVLYALELSLYMRYCCCYIIVLLRSHFFLDFQIVLLSRFFLYYFLKNFNFNFRGDLFVSEWLFISQFTNSQCSFVMSEWPQSFVVVSFDNWNIKLVKFLFCLANNNI